MDRHTGGSPGDREGDKPEADGASIKEDRIIMCARPSDYLKSVGTNWKLYHCSICGCEVMVSGSMIDRVANGWEPCCGECCLAMASFEKQELGENPQFKILPDVAKQLVDMGVSEKQQEVILKMIERGVNGP